MGSIDSVRAALYANPMDDSVQDIIMMLRKLPAQERLLLVSLAAGVPISILRRFYSTHVFTVSKRASRMFEDLMEEYVNAD